MLHKFVKMLLNTETTLYNPQYSSQNIVCQKQYPIGSHTISSFPKMSIPSRSLIVTSSLYCSKHHITLLIKNKLLLSIRRNSYCVNNSSRLVIINMIITSNYFNERTPLLKTQRVLTMKLYLNVTFLFVRVLFFIRSTSDEITCSKILRDFFEYEVSIKVQILHFHVY